MNSSSSRSHSILSVKLTSQRRSTKSEGDNAEEDSGSDEGPAKTSQLHLVDLAGSERASRTGAQGARLKEGAMINTSLSALGNVISVMKPRLIYAVSLLMAALIGSFLFQALVKREHIPYRGTLQFSEMSIFLWFRLTFGLVCNRFKADSNAAELARW